MDSPAITTSSAKRVAAVTGFAIPVGKYRKLSGEPVADAKATDYLVVPAGAIGRFAPTKWGEFGPIRTYRFWAPAGKVSTPNVVTSAPVIQPRVDKDPSRDHRNTKILSSGSGEPCGRRSPLPRVCDLSEEDIEAAESLLNLRSDSRRTRRELETRSASDVHAELLEVCSEGGSEPTNSGGSSSGSEDSEDGDLSEGYPSSGDSECSSSSGLSMHRSTSGLYPKTGYTDSQFDLSSGQEDEASTSGEDSE